MIAVKWKLRDPFEMFKAKFRDKLDVGVGNEVREVKEGRVSGLSN